MSEKSKIPSTLDLPALLNLAAVEVGAIAADVGSADVRYSAYRLRDVRTRLTHAIKELEG